MQLVLRGTAARIRATFLDGDGAATAPANPKVTIERDSDGEEIVSAAAATDEGDGLVSFTLDPADIPQVDLLRASWVADDAGAPDTEVGVVGGFLCTLEAIAAAIDGAAPPAEVLRAKREEAERRLEDACGVAFRPSYARETLCGEGSRSLLVKDHPRLRRVLSASIDGETIDVAELSPSTDGTVRRDDTVWPSSSEVELTYEHGWPSCPEPVGREAVTLAVAYLDVGADRVTRFREDDQEFFLSVPGAGGETGIPSVDQVIRDYGYVLVG